MVTYNFTNDLRTTDLVARIKDASQAIINEETFEDKSKSNVKASLRYFFNLHPNTNTCKDASLEPLLAIRNFILKFQFPHTHTKAIFNASINEKVLFAPYRVAISLLYYMASEDESKESSISLNELIYYTFCNPLIYKNPQINYRYLINKIRKNKLNSGQLEANIQSSLIWNNWSRQINEMMNVLKLACPCFKLNNGKLFFSLKSTEYEECKDFIDIIITYNKFWYPSSCEFNEQIKKEYISYMDTSNTPYTVIDFKDVNNFININDDKTQTPFSVLDIIKRIKDSGLIYNDDLITRYAISLMTKPFVILSGLAGSGKTQLALAFANCLVENEEEQICFVSVGADWTNREPLLGYPSALGDKKYIKPESGVLDIILRAKENPQKPYFLILDEMNLSYVERYFADFLSAMEAHKKISLWEGDEHLPANVELPKNLFITGTINVDETTYMFSPKVLDRANVIEFKIDNEDIKKFFEESPNPQPSILVSAASSMAYSFVESSRKDIILDSEANDVLLNFFKELKKVNSEFGYRVAVEIGRFISIAKAYDTHLRFNLDTYVDFAIVQKLLPKLHGSRKRLDKTLTALWDLCQKDGGKKISEATLEDAVNAKYKESANKILRMYIAANENGFTSFAEA